MGNSNAFIYLGIPATVAASVIEGKITDPRKYFAARRPAHRPVRPRTESPTMDSRRRPSSTATTSTPTTSSRQVQVQVARHGGHGASRHGGARPGLLREGKPRAASSWPARTSAWARAASRRRWCSSTRATPRCSRRASRASSTATRSTPACRGGRATPTSSTTATISRSTWRPACCTNVTKGTEIAFPPLPPVMPHLLADGGLVEHFKKHGRLAARLGAAGHLSR